MKRSVKLFQFLKELYRTIGFFPTQSGQIPFNWRNSLIFLPILQLFLSTSAFFLFKADSIFEYGTSFFASNATLCGIVVFLIKLWKMADILALIQMFDEFIEKRAHNATSTVKYIELNAKIERMSKYIHVFLVKIGTPASMMFPLILTLVNYFVFDLKTEPFYLTFPVMMPFNWKTPFGYVIAYLIESSAFYFIVLGCVPMVCFLVGSCSLFMSFANDITDDFRIMDVDNRRAKIRDNENIGERNGNITERFCNAAQLFADAKELINEFNHIYEFIVTGMFAWTLSAIASSLLVVQKELTQANSNPVEFLLQILLMLASFVFVSLFCELGEMISKRYQEVNQQLFECNWIEFPIEIQRMLVIVTANIQQPANICGYGNILCTRNTLKMTIKKGFAYFMMLRNVDA